MCHYHVWCLVGLIKMSFRVDWNRGMYITIFFVSTCFITFCWCAFSLYALILLWQKMAVNLHAACKKTNSCAAQEALLACFLLSCSTQSISHVQHTKIAYVQYTKVNSHAAHFMSHTCFDSSHNKKWRTHTCSSHVSVNLDMSCTVAKWFFLPRDGWLLYCI